MIPGAYTGDPYLALIGLVLLAAIFAIVALSCHKTKNAKGQKTKDNGASKLCPACGGSGKIEDQAPDSTDIQFTKCERCGGEGYIAGA